MRPFGRRTSAATLVATEWRAYGADVPGTLVRHGMAISGVFDLAPMIATSMNADLRLDAEQASAVSPAFWPVPSGVVFEAWVGGDESSEFLRQSQLVVDRWASAGAQTLYSAIPGANHFTAPNPLADPGSGNGRCPGRASPKCRQGLILQCPFHRFRATSEPLAQR